jgi:tripartite-type tricarboxylate transporter receptor subunit TctC
MGEAQQEGAAFPAKPLEIVCPFGAGGANDVLARIVSKTAEKYLGQEIIVRNYPGGGQVTGQLEAWNRPADGYAVLSINPGIIQNPILKDVPFEYDDWEPIVLPEVFAVNAKSPYKTFEDVIAASKRKPLKLITPGAGTNPHVCGMYVEQQTGARFEYVHAQSGADETMMLIGGHGDALINTIGAVYTAVQEGDVRLLGVMGEEVTDSIKEVDTKVETFYDMGYDVGYWAWRGFGVKKGTPQEVVDILHDAFKKAVFDPECAKGFEEAGFSVVFKDGEDLKEFIRYQQGYMSELLRKVQ